MRIREPVTFQGNKESDPAINTYVNLDMVMSPF